MSIVSYTCSPETEFDPLREEVSRIGKPWRRIELITHRFFYRGEEVEVMRDLTFHLGSRRIGFGVTLSFCRGVHDYSEQLAAESEDSE